MHRSLWCRDQTHGLWPQGKHSSNWPTFPVLDLGFNKIYRTHTSPDFQTHLQYSMGPGWGTKHPDIFLLRHHPLDSTAPFTRRHRALCLFPALLTGTWPYMVADWLSQGLRGREGQPPLDRFGSWVAWTTKGPFRSPIWMTLWLGTYLVPAAFWLLSTPLHVLHSILTYGQAEVLQPFIYRAVNSWESGWGEVGALNENASLGRWAFVL